MPTVSGNFNASLLTPGFRVIWGTDQKDWEEEYSKVFDLETSTKNKEEDYSITELGLAVEKAQGASITYDTIYEGFKKTYTHTTLGLGFSVSREMVEDDLYRKIKQMPKALSRSVKHTVEITAANVLNRAATAGYTGGDGKVLLATDHPTYGGGGTYRNTPSTACDLDITSFENALIDIGTVFIDDRGLKMAVKPVKGIIHPSNIFMMEKILKSASEPDTANNAINPAKGSLPQGYVVMHWLTDSDAWFIKTDVSNGLNWFWRRRPEFTQDNDFDTENAKYKATYRCSSGWTNPRALYGTMGG